MCRHLVLLRPIQTLYENKLFHILSTFTKQFQNFQPVNMEKKMTIKSRENPVIMKLDKSKFEYVLKPELVKLAEIFTKNNFELRIAGGAVRDLLLGYKPQDVDFATDATPDEMKKMFTDESIRMINKRGEKHGTITARIDDKENYEITTLRIDIATDGRRAEVQFTKNWKMDANRRDLTINSMFLDLEGNVYDYFYGHDDLQERRVLFVGNAADRIVEDYLRIFRYFRFYGRIANQPDNHNKETIDAIKENVSGLKQISGERIWSEWEKILKGNYGCELTLKLIECGIAPYCGLPENPNTEEFQKIYHECSSRNIPLKPMTLVSLLLETVTDVANLHARLKLSAHDRDLAFFLVRERENKGIEKDLKYYQKIVIFKKGKLPDPKGYTTELIKCDYNFDVLKEFINWNLPAFPINGYILKEYVSDQKLIGLVIYELQKIWIDSDYTLKKDELLDVVPKIVKIIKDGGILE
ncbi:CCA tRNA nucleotidyltransferase 1, mitochondrial-like [Prorops nasuta]|uniref:CCA tRNA nucleotidyltransferase 1, mitochondrial-like n=1 Tax=Prorops nasuta TaxID=863751 RepID=UPI0034CF28B6